MANHLFGPVPSRRLGRSLGVDLVPLKTCPYDCSYCQLGRTDNHTAERRAWVPVGEVLAELERQLAADRPDYITLSGSGEPTLNSGIGELIGRIKQLSDVPVAVLTNGALLGDPAVRAALYPADLVLPSLDAGDAATFAKVNRPCAGIEFEPMFSGLIEFAHEYSGQLWLEVFLLKGINDRGEPLQRLVDRARQVPAERIQLNTVARPPAEDTAQAVDEEQMLELAQLFGPAAEVVADFTGVHQTREAQAGRSAVEQLLARRPCTVEDIAGGLQLHRNEVLKHLTELLKQKRIGSVRRGSETYYRSTE